MLPYPEKGPEKPKRFTRDQLRNLTLEQLAQVTENFLSKLSNPDEDYPIVEEKTGITQLNLENFVKVFNEQYLPIVIEWGRRQATEIDFPKYRELFLRLQSTELPSKIKNELIELRKKQFDQLELSKEERKRLLEIEAINSLIKKNMPYKWAELIVSHKEQIIKTLRDLQKKQASASLTSEENNIKNFFEPYYQELLQISEDNE